jgi:cytochrome c-type biogenesis protein CcmH
VPKFLTSLFASLLVCFASAVVAAPQDAAQAAALDRRVQHVTEELRCLVCQNQTIADSHAELAIMLKKQVRTMLEGGKSDQEAIDFMVQRYGDFVLYRPPVKGSTWLLWFGPFLLLAAGLALLFSWLRKQAGGADAGESDTAVVNAGEVAP